MAPTQTLIKVDLVAIFDGFESSCAWMLRTGRVHDVAVFLLIFEKQGNNAGRVTQVP